MECDKLSRSDIIRYSRQLLVNEFGLKGQTKLKNKSVLIIGAGGLGCPSAQYLAGAGIGRLGIVDYDTVDETNLHRQVLHSEDGLGIPKAESLCNRLQKLNSNVSYHPYNMQVDSTNIMPIIKDYDVVLDCSDNMPTRYLLNDACVLLKKPLVSASALKWEGQLAIYNFEGGPCFRCIFPSPTPPDALNNCSDSGVMGPVTGVLGSMQALEAMKILGGVTVSLKGKMLLYDGLSCDFTTVTLRGRKKDCPVCGDHPIITGLVDYEVFCQSPANDKNRSLKLVDDDHRITPQKLNELRKGDSDFLIIDVRKAAELEICRLSNSLNIPLDNITTNSGVARVEELIDEKISASEKPVTKLTVCFICRRGHDSQRALSYFLKREEQISNKFVRLVDLKGGLIAWQNDIDERMPIY